METKYRLIKTVTEGKESFGLEAVRQFSDVFKSEEDGYAFVKKCEELGLSDIHIEDVLDDYLNE